ncbi:hypothetical protein IPM09_01860 [Candidatus Saccharibacteria bacterium]|nr:MAG: hypothetical protein IPM09_01860 [Candidatus Saccharibacteria bacterium]
MGEKAPKSTDGYVCSAKSARLLSRLADHSDYVYVVGNRVVVEKMIDTPYNEHGIVDTRELFRRVLGTVSTEYYWQGSYEGPHHIMWPRGWYRQKTDGKQIAMQFRNSPTLRLYLPRDLHDFTHKITDPPVPPSRDVMEQYILEQCQVQNLYDIVRFHGLHDLHGMAHDDKEAYRLERFRERLSEMEDGYVGVMPSREFLAALPLHTARQVVRSLARVQGLSNDKASRKAFFSPSRSQLVA